MKAFHVTLDNNKSVLGQIPLTRLGSGSGLLSTMREPRQPRRFWPVEYVAPGQYSLEQVHLLEQRSGKAVEYRLSVQKDLLDPKDDRVLLMIDVPCGSGGYTDIHAPNDDSPQSGLFTRSNKDPKKFLAREGVVLLEEGILTSPTGDHYSSWLVVAQPNVRFELSVTGHRPGQPTRYRLQRNFGKWCFEAVKGSEQKRPTVQPRILRQVVVTR